MDVGEVYIPSLSEDISSLISEHQSIERNLGQIYMPTMSAEETKELIIKGEIPLSLKFDKGVINKIVQLACGYPHFAHSLCYHSVNTAIMTEGDAVSDIHL